MTPEQALSLIVQVLPKLSLPLEDHKTLQGAMNVLKIAITPKEEAEKTD